MPGKLQFATPARSPKSGLRTRPATVKTNSAIFTKYIGRLKIGPEQQLQLPLGVFGPDRPEKGFSVELSPNPDPTESVVTEVFSVGSERRYELILSVANYGGRAVTAEVWGI